MARYPYHLLPSDKDFESLVWDLCRYLLGEGTEKFPAGRDGGRDARFRGQAMRFPSEGKPLSGNFIVQAKWTQVEDSSFSDKPFQRMLMTEEVPRVIKLIAAGELDHWMLFSNRKKPPDGATKLEMELVNATGCKSIHLRGADEIDGWLRSLQEIVRRNSLDALLIPMRLEPQELHEVIDVLHQRRTLVSDKASTRWNYPAYLGIDRKNATNELSDRYFRSVIRQQSEPYFAAIKTFLENPRNRKLAERYHESATEIQAKVMTFRDRFDHFDLVFDTLCEEFWTSSPGLQSPGKKRLVRLLLHYMYCNCDFGEAAT